MSSFRPEVRRALPSIVAVRFLINVSMRMAYTFLPAFARGTGLSVGATSGVLSARELTALSAPLMGRLGDRHGAVRVMGLSGLVAGAGLLIATLGAPGLMIGFVVLGFGRTANQVTLNAWVGSEVAYERRGRATGLIELTWGGAALVGLPLVGLLIDGIAWWMPLAVLGGLVMLFSALILRRESAAHRPDPTSTRKPHMTSAAVAALATNGALTAAAQFLFLTHGLWLEDEYALDTAEVGLAIVAVGAVEVVATMGSSRLTDGLGKRRSILGGTALMTVMMVLLAVVDAPPLWLGLLILVTAFLGFEFGIVSAIPLLSELDPGARAQMVGRAVSVTTLVRAAITPLATVLYTSVGFSATMFTAAGAGLIAIVLAAFVMVEPG
ncbi:MAG: MFS transporter [Actinomycetota bacterium]